MDDVIKKRGFTTFKTVLYIAVALFIAATVANTAYTMKGIDTGLGLKAMGTCLWFGVITGMIALTVGGFVRAAIWNSKGYKGTPIPMVFFLKNDDKITKMTDILMNFEPMLPRDLLEVLCSTEGTIAGSDLEIEVPATERIVFSCEGFLLLLLGVALFFANQPALGSGAFFAIALIAIFNYTRVKTFHGATIKSKYYAEGHGIYYVLRQAAAMGLPLDHLLEEFSDMEVETYDEKVFDFFALTCWEGIFIQKCCSPTNKPKLNDIAQSFLVTERLHGFAAREVAITKERLNLNSIYACCTLIHGSQEDRDNLIEEYYDKINLGNKGRGAAIQRELDWHRAMLAGEPVDVKAHPLFHPVDFLKAFPEYQRMVREIQERIEGED